MSHEILRRESVAATVNSTENRTVAGIAVPYGVETEIWAGYYEQISPGAWGPRADGLTGTKLLYRHRDVIGTITEAENRPEGLYISARISETTLGNDVYTLAKDGAIDRFSIGFLPLEYTREEREDGEHTTITSIDVLEVSLVPWPAYEGAKVEEVREAPQPLQVKENAMTTVETLATRMDETASAVDEIRAALADLNQRAAFNAAPDPTPAVDTRSAAEFLCDLVEDRANTQAEYNELLARAFTGTKSDADPTMATPTWMKDLARLYNIPDLLKPLFSTGPLPDTGMELEYAVLKTNTMTVEEHEEGEDIAMGKVEFKKATAKITAYSGGTKITRRAIERTRLPLLQRHLEALALAAGTQSAKAFADTLAAAVKAQDTKKLSITKAIDTLKWADLSGLIVDAAHEYQKLNLSLDGLIVNKATFKTLAAMTATDGRPLMTVTGTGANTVGHIDLSGLSGDLVGVRVVPNFIHSGAELGTGIVGTFFNSMAIRSYESPLVQLQDENILNLSKGFAVYRYGANAVEIPDALIPLKIGA